MKVDNIFENYSIIPEDTFRIPFHFENPSEHISFRHFLKNLENAQKLDKYNNILQQINILEIPSTGYKTAFYNNSEY